MDKDRLLELIKGIYDKVRSGNLLPLFLSESLVEFKFSKAGLQLREDHVISTSTGEVDYYVYVYEDYGTDDPILIDRVIVVDPLIWDHIADRMVDRANEYLPDADLYDVLKKLFIEARKHKSGDMFSSMLGELNERK